MKAPKSQGLTTLLALATLAGAEGEHASSTNYTHKATGSNQLGGGICQSAHYQSLSYLSEKAPETVPHRSPSMRDGLEAQHIQVIGLQLVAPATAMDEQASLPLELLYQNDDDSLSPIPSNDQVAWETEGPGTIASPTGPTELQASSVHADSEVTITAQIGTLETLGIVQIRNVDDDDFGPYADDGVDDAWQVTHFGLSDPQGHGDADPDGDGLTNAQEFLAGSNPHEGPEPNRDPIALKIMAFERQTDGSYHIRFQAESEASIALERSTDLTPESWQIIDTYTGTDTIILSQEAATTQFFRLRPID